MARLDEEFERRWHQEAEAVMSGMKEWRLQHPKATFQRWQPGQRADPPRRCTTR